ncbi:MAG: NAD(P)-dependent oxidoreductase, partial [Rhizobiales bacterium]|nr:NAD(P)-dependent oxidoreductase [Hyphomicrobiales bacterium]
TVFVGGDRDVFQRHLPALQAMCGPIHVGPLGAASLLKVITNMLCLIDLVAAGEALLLAKQGGLDLATCYQAICDSSGTSREFEDWAPVILNGSLNTGFTLELGCKDLGFVSDLGRSHGVPLKLSALVEQLFIEARAKHGGSAWTPHVVKMMEDATGLQLRADGFGDVIPKT